MVTLSRFERRAAAVAADADLPRFRAGDAGGHYESWFMRANHPSRPLAFWIRYTIFSPRGRPADAVGELWAIVFDAERGRHRAARAELPIGACRFDPDGAEVGAATLSRDALRGGVVGAEISLAWDLRVTGGGSPLLLLPAGLYDGGFPKAKALVSAPLARFDGGLVVDGERVAVDGWVGSRNHNWGSRHTDRYAWAQVAGFDDSPDTFLELAAAKLKIGPLWTPWLTPIVLRHGGREHRLNALHRTLGRSRLGGFGWSFAASGAGVRLEGRIEAAPEDFVALAYGNPPGGVKRCLNSKVARCELSLRVDGEAARRRLATARRAAFEILTDDDDPRVAQIGATCSAAEIANHPPS